MIGRKRSRPAASVLSVYGSSCCLEQQALADDLILRTNLDVVHEGNSLVTLIALQQDDFVVFLVLDDRSVALEALAHVPQDLLKVELVVKALDESHGVSTSSLLYTNSDLVRETIISLDKVC